MKKNLLRVLCVITVLFVVASYYRIFEREVSKQLFSDLPSHLSYAERIFSEPIVYPLFHYSVLAVSKITQWNIGYSAIIVLLLSVLSSAIILATVLNEKLDGRYSWPVIILMTSMVFCVSAIYVPAFCEKIYLCCGSQNSYHNPTSIFSKPFAFISVILFSRLSVAYHESRIRLAILTSVFVLIGAFSKPNFAFAFLFSAPLFLYLNRKKLRDWGEMVIVSAPLLVLVIVLSVQYYSNYLLGSSGPDDSRVIIDFFGVARIYTPNPFISLVLLAAFPLATIFLYPSILKDRLFSISFLTFLVAVVQYWVLAEAGPSYSHGNFGWGMEIILPLVSVLCVGEMLNRLRSENTTLGMIKSGFLVCLFSAHLVSGLLYLKQVLTTDSYY